MGASINEEADERLEGVGNRLFEEATNGMSAGRGEEDHVENHQVQLTSSLSKFCEG